MAKQKAARKAPPKITREGGNKKRFPARAKKAAPKQSKREVAKVLSNGPVRRIVPTRPKAAPLPGMEDMSKLSKKLLDIMDSMSDQMHLANTANATIKGLNNNALNQMKRDGVTVAKAHGIELVRVPGEEKLRKRLLDAGSGATDEDTSDVDTHEDAEQDANVLANESGVMAMDAHEQP